jgi:hypothetical protein
MSSPDSHSKIPAENLLRGRPTVGHSRVIRHEDKTEITETTPVVERPQVREDCEGGPRPCPLVGCLYNNYLTVDCHGNIKIAHGNRDPEDVPADESCVLDVADSGPHTLEDVGRITGLTRERVRQIVIKIISKIRNTVEENDLQAATSQPSRK